MAFFPTECGTWNPDCVNTAGLSLSLVLLTTAVYMVHALSLPFWPLVRLVMWLLISFVATAFYKEAMVWLSGRSLRVTAWRQFFNLAATTLGGEIWLHVACVLPYIVSTAWDLHGPFYDSSSTGDDTVPLFPEARNFEWEQSVSSDTFLVCDPVVGAGTTIVTALGLWVSRFFRW